MCRRRCSICRRGLRCALPRQASLDGGTDPRTERIRKTTPIVAVLEQLVRYPAEAPEVNRAHLRIEWRHEVADLNKCCRALAVGPVLRHGVAEKLSEKKSDTELPRRRRSREVGGKKDLRVFQDRRWIVRVANGGHKKPRSPDVSSRNGYQCSPARLGGKRSVTASALSCLKYWPGPSAPFRLSWETPGWLFRKR